MQTVRYDSKSYLGLMQTIHQPARYRRDELDEGSSEPLDGRPVCLSLLASVRIILRYIGRVVPSENGERSKETRQPRPPDAPKREGGAQFAS
ncbi:Hypothetical protein NTJ_01198 [Nesidiocoris tenuis]|uniref:Uncharacterized protein n=1 Tax=Nesidiocoris tenuis TaxID=355587 RepID=A0ABN7A7X8_9HEMI|nr:Hypothetical protein NTJ_01198 [Nesidiocoris tenuis]